MLDKSHGSRSESNPCFVFWWLLVPHDVCLALRWPCGVYNWSQDRTRHGKAFFMTCAVRVIVSAMRSMAASLTSGVHRVAVKPCSGDEQAQLVRNGIKSDAGGREICPVIFNLQCYPLKKNKNIGGFLCPM
jgi:hypothetical protein